MYVGNTRYNVDWSLNVNMLPFVDKSARGKKKSHRESQYDKFDGSFMFSSDHFVNAGFDLSIHISFLLQL